MIASTQKLKVFISSKCGEQKYDIVRAGLKKLIESTQLADVYLFEDEEASTISAGHHYIYALEDSDLCIFLIDNADGIPNGVQKEIDVAKKYKIKSLYYFCTEMSSTETPLQKSLTGIEHAKSKNVNSFKELLTSPASALLDDLILVYRYYCKGRIDSITENNFQENTSATTKDNFFLAFPVLKSILANIDNCKNYFSQLIFQDNTVIKNTGSLDVHCCNFLSVMFENKSILDFNAAFLLQELKKLHSADYYDVVEKRWEAIQAYYQGQLTNCFDLLNVALNKAKDNSLPKWFIQDILIDLRNIAGIHGESQSNSFANIDVQKELDSVDSVLHYPLLDRLNSNLYESYLQSEFKEKIQSPHSVTFGGNLSSYTDLLASKYIVASVNGSLTHMLMLFEQIRDLSFHLISRFSNWHFRILMLETTVVNGRKTDIDGVIRRYNDILCKLNDIDAKRIYDFSCNRIIKYQKFISNLDAFRVVGYFFSDSDYDNIWRDLNKRINEWLNSEHPCIYVGQSLFTSLSGNFYRLDQNALADICSQTIEKNIFRVYDEMFDLLAMPIELSKLLPQTAKRLINNIISVVSNKNFMKRFTSFHTVLYAFRKNNRTLTESLDIAVKQHMPQFYEGSYKLNTSQNEHGDMLLFLQKYIDIATERNETQGQNGTYKGYMDAPFSTIKNIIEHNTVSFEPYQISAAFKVAAETLLNEKHSISDKNDAILLIIFISQKYPDILQNNHDLVSKLQNSKESVISSECTLTNLSDISLRLSSLFMYHCFGENIWIPLVEVLADIKDDEPTIIHASKSISIFLEFYAVERINAELISILLQYSLLWCRESNLEIRWSAMSSLLLLIDDIKCSAVICNQLVKAMDTDDVYIKNRILRNINKIKAIDKATHDYILQKASLDTNFVVRQVYSEATK